MATRPCREVVDDLKRNKKNRSFAELRGILEECGFVMHAKSSGSHRPFSKPGCEMNVSIPDEREVLAAYVRKVIQALEECCCE